MEYAYILAHEIDITEEPEKDDWVDLGVYSTQEKAEEALERYKKLTRFADYQDGFSISRYRINEDNWTSGYATVWY